MHHLPSILSRIKSLLKIFLMNFVLGDRSLHVLAHTHSQKYYPSCHHRLLTFFITFLSSYLRAAGCFFSSWKTELAHTLFLIHPATRKGFSNFIVTISCCLILMHVFFYLLSVLSSFFLLCCLPFCGCLPPFWRIYCVVDEPREVCCFLVKILTPDNE